MIKEYRCKFCKVWTDRASARKCLQTHMKTNRAVRISKREGSNITEGVECRVFEEDENEI